MASILVTVTFCCNTRCQDDEVVAYGKEKWLPQYLKKGGAGAELPDLFKKLQKALKESCYIHQRYKLDEDGNPAILEARKLVAEALVTTSEATLLISMNNKNPDQAQAEVTHQLAKMASQKVSQICLPLLQAAQSIANGVKK